MLCFCDKGGSFRVTKSSWANLYLYKSVHETWNAAAHGRGMWTDGFVPLAKGYKCCFTTLGVQLEIGYLSN